MTKKMIYAPIQTPWKSNVIVFVEDFVGSLDEVIARINGLKEEYSGKDLTLEWAAGDGGWVDDGNFVLKEHRLETDAEYKTRLDREERRKKTTEDHERDLLAKLTKKYGEEK